MRSELAEILRHFVLKSRRGMVSEAIAEFEGLQEIGGRDRDRHADRDTYQCRHRHTCRTNKRLAVR